MFTRRTLVIAAVVALFVSAVGCGRHHCCKNNGSVSLAPATTPCDPCR